MRLLLLLLALTCAVTTVSFAADESSPADYERSLMAIFVFGDTGGWMGSGFVVGDGGWVVTTANLVTEAVGPGTIVTVNSITALSSFTGEAYRAEVKFADPKTNLALLKLPIKGLPAVPLATKSSVFQRLCGVTIGQALSGELQGSKWETALYALGQEASPGKPTTLTVKKWQAQNACVAESKGVNWLFLSKIDPSTSPSNAALVWRTGAGAVGIYDSKLVVEGSGKPVTYGHALPSTEIVKALEKAGVDGASLRAVPEPTVKADKVSEQALQSISRVFSSTITGRWSTAQREAKSLVDLRPESGFAHLLLGVALAGGGKLEDAINSMDKAITLDPATPGAYLSRGAALASLGKAKEAEADLKKAVEQAPSDPKSLIALADVIAMDKDRLSEAAATATKAVQLAPEHPGPRMTLALILKAQRSYDKAIAEFNTLLKTSPNWGAAKAALAATYEASGNLSQAETQYRDLAKAESNNPDALFALASFLADHDKKDEAKKLVSQILEMKPPKELETAAKELEKKLE